MDEEPSVLDYVKALLTPWKGKPPQIPADPTAVVREDQPVPAENVVEMRSASAERVLDDEAEAPLAASTTAVRYAPVPEIPEAPLQPALVLARRFPWLLILAFILALIAQVNLEPPERTVKLAIILYSAAGVCLILGMILKEWNWNEPENSNGPELSKQFSAAPFWVSLVFLAAAFYLFRGNLFTGLNLILWIVGLLLLIGSMLEVKGSAAQAWAKVRGFFKRQTWTLRISRWSIVMLLALGVAVFFRFYRLSGVPAEMFSDHAEKLLDVSDVLAGQFSIFFPRNTGREAFQMYLTALVGIVFGTDLSFMSLKIGTALCGFFTLPYIYLLGRQIGNRWVGLFAFVLAAFAYWPNVISRVGLRFPLTPLFVAPVMFYLVRGLQERRRNDFIWAGIALGIGLHGYSPTRFLPVVVVMGVLLYILHRQSQGNRKGAVTGLMIVAGVSLAVFLPLLMYMLENFDMFWYRALSRSGTTEATYPGPVILIFLNNLWKSMIMFFYDNGQIWVHSVTGRPAMDFITAGLYFLGLILILLRYVRRRNWIDLFLFLSIPVLMMPSILSLAFPDENPSLNRSGGAIVPVFIVAGLGLEALLSAIKQQLRGKTAQVIPALLAVGILGMSAATNYDLVFNQYDQQFRANAWNTSDIGTVIRSFATSEGSYDTAYVIPYAYWVDTRLVGINAGDPLKDYALGRENISITLADQRAKLFIFNVEDTETAAQLEALYPDGNLYLYDVALDGKDFLTYYVPPTD